MNIRNNGKLKDILAAFQRAVAENQAVTLTGGETDLRLTRAETEGAAKVLAAVVAVMSAKVSKIRRAQVRRANESGEGWGSWRKGALTKAKGAQLIARAMEGRSGPELAKEFVIPETAVYKRLSRAGVKIRKIV